MKRALTVTALLAMGLLVASSFAAAQDAPPKTSGGQVVFGALGVEEISSAKFQEYRDVPKGISIPYANLFARKDGFDFNLEAFKVRQKDQRYTGRLNTGRMGLSFDYNQVPHNMGNNGRTIFAESAPGVWTMSATLREALQIANDTKLPTTARTVTFYDELLGPTFASANSLDISSLRQRGNAVLDLSNSLPFDLAFTYMRERKSGYRTHSGGNVRGQVNPAYELPEPLDEITQDFGLRAAHNFKAGNVHAAFNRNVYNNRAETLIIDNPFQAYDAPSTSTVGGPSRGRFINAPDNEASTGSAGFLVKFARQTRIGGDLSLATWTQDAPFYPYTINTVVLTPAGARADSLSTLQQPSFNGKINTTTLNFTFSSRPVKGLGLRAAYRSYDLTNKTDRYIVTGDTSVSDRAWTVVTPTAADPYGHATANPYDTKTTRFTASVSYDVGDLTLEGAFHNTDITRTYREATSGTDAGYLLAAIYRTNDWLSLRAKYENANRTAEGHTIYGFQADEAERDVTRASVQLQLTPLSGFDLGFTYGKRDVTYPNRPNRIAVTSGAPTPGAQPIPNTPSGLLDAKYDTFTVDVDYTPNARTALGAYYTYEKDANTNQWSTTTGVSLNNLLNYAGSDKTNTFGVNATFQLVPDKWTGTFNAMHQKVDGLMDITANETGSFYNPGRTTLIRTGQGGAQDITDWDDTELTTLSAQLDYAVDKAWTMSAGYMYEKYDFKDAYTSGDLLMPQSVYIFMKADNGPYTANVVYATLKYAW